MSNDRFFLIRLLAPRATFMQDMTDSERAAINGGLAQRLFGL